MKLLRSTKIAIYSGYNKLRLWCRGYSDFYSFPFDVSTALNEYAEQTLAEGCQILESEGIPYFVCDGTVLGIVRENGLISHDNDIDIAVAQEVDLDRLVEAFQQRGYKVGRKVLYRGKIQQLIFYSCHEVIYDICFWREKGDGFSYHYVPEVPNGRKQPSRYFKAPEFINFRGRRYTTHPQIREWLREHYGDDWTVPKLSKGDWRLDVKDLVE